MTNSYRLLAVDLDGTLVGPDLIMRPAVKRAVARLMDSGVAVVLATGRMYRSARRFALEVGTTTPIICYQGALIQSPAHGHAMLHRSVPLGLAHEAIAFAKARNITINAYVDDWAYTDLWTAEEEYYSDVNQIEVSLEDDLLEFLKQRPTKLVAISDDAGAGPLYRMLYDRFGTRLQVVQSHHRFAELTHRSASKGNALRYLARHLGVRRAEVVAVGDQQNDISMIRTAGLGIAMGDADPLLKQEAAMIAPPVMEDGVAWVIKTVFGIS